MNELSLSIMFFVCRKQKFVVKDVAALKRLKPTALRICLTVYDSKYEATFLKHRVFLV
jgi:hypothetical protein